MYYGIREHAMGCIMNGFAYYGLFRPSGATFLVFADYMRAAVRIASLAELGVSYIWTHDSIGVGEDGPTHQPVETVSGLRAFPNLDVIRPADYEETAGAYVASAVRTDGPTALILSRQNLDQLTDCPAATRREGTLKGAYVVAKESGPLECIIIATGSEVQHAVKAAKEIGGGVRVVSMPSAGPSGIEPSLQRERRRGAADPSDVEGRGDPVRGSFARRRTYLRVVA